MKAEKKILIIAYPGIVILSHAPPETILLAAEATEVLNTIIDEIIYFLLQWDIWWVCLNPELAK